jgi:hypothetical protein
MTTVVPIAKFKLEDKVMYIEATMDGDVCLGKTAIATCVTERVFTTEMGWMYYLKGRHGYFKEEILRPYIEGQTELSVEHHDGDSDGFITDVINPDKMHEPLFKVGDYVSCEEGGGKDTYTALLLIIGCIWDLDEYVYDCALLDPSGNFIVIKDAYGEDELDAMDRSVMEEYRRKLVNPRPRPTLAYSR